MMNGSLSAYDPESFKQQLATRTASRRAPLHGTSNRATIESVVADRREQTSESAKKTNRKPKAATDRFTFLSC